MPDPPTIGGRMRRATWAFFFAVVTLLPLMDMQSADYQKILVQAIGLLLSTGLLFFTTDRSWVLIEDAQVCLGPTGWRMTLLDAVAPS